MDVRGITVVAAGVLVGGCNGNPTTPTAVPTPDTGCHRAVPRHLRRHVECSHAPGGLPGGAHWSPLIGGTHNAMVSFWSPGGMASPGIERMAEGGATSPLYEEIMASIVDVTKQQVFRRNVSFSSPDSDSLEFEISVDFPLVTLTSMVAPSPDWFVGVGGMSLLVNNAWVAERVVQLRPWDADTDSGSTFASPDADTQPRDPIALITTPPLAPSGQAAPMGTFTFTRIDS